LNILLSSKKGTTGKNPDIEVTENLREWEYGLYEGKLTKEIRAERKQRGLDKKREWDIWTDGCEEGELPAQVTGRLDELISRIRDIQGPHLKDEAPSDVIIVAHGHILRAFTKRWLGYELSERLLLMLEPGGLGILT
jgi:probable phosphoglycerate mutase